MRSSRTDSNRRPTDYKSVTLPTELLEHSFIYLLTIITVSIFFVNGCCTQLNTNMDVLSFSHGQTQSKLWLCDTIEQYLPENAVVVILGCWYNMLGFMLLTRNRDMYQHILGVDIALEAITGADILCQGFMLGNNAQIRNVCKDADTLNLQGHRVVINTSVEHMKDDWFDNVDPGALVCIQSSDVTDQKEPWLVTNPCTNIESLQERFPLTELLFAETKLFDYGSSSYNRYMIIGRK